MYHHVKSQTCVMERGSSLNVCVQNNNLITISHIPRCSVEFTLLLLVIEVMLCGW